MVAKAAELGQTAIALTDHGNLYGTVEFYTAAKSAGIKPIIGVEGYVASRSRFDRDPNDRFPYHITILAKDDQGYANLLKLVSAAHLEGFYYRPRMDRELLSKHAEGLIVLSGCPSGEVPKLVASGQLERARDTAKWYRGVFGEDYFFELMSHDGVPDLPEINRGLTELSKELGIPLVATNDTHYTSPEEHELQDILLCIQTNSTVDDANRMKFDGDSFYLRSEEEMAGLWPDLPEAISNTQVIANRCDVTIEFGRSRLPRYTTPDGESALEFLTTLCEIGLRDRYPEASSEVEARLKHELDVIDKTGFADYFLVARDIGQLARERGILMGVRGSAAASLVLYCLGVTDVDPIETNLVFERFLNIERREMPDIDFDFQDDRRGEVIRWAADTYGEGHVAQIITFGTLGAKAAVRDVGRALGMDLADVDRMARLIPTRLGITLEKALEESHELSELAESTPAYRRLIRSARALEGTVRHASTHAAAVVITEDPLTDVVPLQRATSGNEEAIPATQFSMDPVAKLGLLKMDFLGLTNLTILDRALKLVNQRRGTNLSLHEIPLDDQPTFDLLGSGETFGVFQLESEGMRRYVKDLKPSSVADVSAMIALYRPGPMEHIPTFIDAKHGRREITYPHEDLKDILEETYGIIVYQDQVLLIARKFGGYSLGEADILRKAMGKKDPEVMAAEREKFIQGALEKGYSKDLAVTMFELIEPFAGYAFNKAHSACYAMVAYWTAYLKANYKVEYMSALLGAVAHNPDRLAAAIQETKRVAVRVLGPDVNRSHLGFTIDQTEDGEEAVRFGLASVKNVGTSGVEPIIRAREKDGAFESLEDFCRRVEFKSVSARLLESLVKVGALDALGRRVSLLESVDRIVGRIQQEIRLRESGQATMFDLLGEQVPTPTPEVSLSDGDDDVTERERLLWERDLLGVEITESAFTREMYANADRFVVFAREVTADQAGQRKGLLGQVRSVRRLTTRNGDPFLAVGVGLLDGEVEVMVWPRLLKSTESLWQEGNHVTVLGSVRDRDGRVSISAEEAKEYGWSSGGGSAPAIGEPTESLPTSGSSAPSRPAAPVALQEETAGAGESEGARFNGKARSGSYQEGIGGNGASNGASEHIASSTPTGNGYGVSSSGVVVRMQDTGQLLEDRYRLEDLVKTLLEYHGDEAVTLEIETEGRIVRMEMPFVTIRSCPELTDRLTDLLGAQNVRAQ